MMNRTQIKAAAAALNINVEYSRYGHPVAVNGEVLTEKPWISLQSFVVAAQQELIRAAEAVVEEKSRATIPTSTPVTPHHVAPAAQATPARGTNVPAPKALHPLRGYVVTTKQRVCEVMKQMYKVGLDRLTNVQMFARLLAKHLGADVRVRVVDGVTWLLVSKGNSRKAFQF